MKPPVYSVWLMPCAKQRNDLEALVGELSDRCGMPPFSPHATLCSGEWAGAEKALHSVFKSLAERIAPVELPVEGIEWTDHWATFFFLRLTAAGNFFERAASGIEGSHLSPQGPHLSLLYGVDAPQLDRPALRQELCGRLPPAIRFDSAALVQPSSGRWEDVGSWEILSSVQLSV